MTVFPGCRNWTQTHRLGDVLDASIALASFMCAENYGHGPKGSRHALSHAHCRSGLCQFIVRNCNTAFQPRT